MTDPLWYLTQAEARLTALMQAAEALGHASLATTLADVRADVRLAKLGLPCASLPR